MQLEIITPDKKVFTEEIDELTVPTILGEITILPHHANLVSKVTPGEIIVKNGKKEQYLGITGGFLEVNNGAITILADYAVRSQDIEVNKAIEAQKRAEEKLKKRKEMASERDIALAEAELRKSILEINVATKRKRRNL